MPNQILTYFFVFRVKKEQRGKDEDACSRLYQLQEILLLFFFNSTYKMHTKAIIVSNTLQHP